MNIKNGQIWYNIFIDKLYEVFFLDEYFVYVMSLDGMRHYPVEYIRDCFEYIGDV